MHNRFEVGIEPGQQGTRLLHQVLFVPLGFLAGHAGQLCFAGLLLFYLRLELFFVHQLFLSLVHALSDGVLLVQQVVEYVGLKVFCPSPVIRLYLNQFLRAVLLSKSTSKVNEPAQLVLRLF